MMEKFRGQAATEVLILIGLMMLLLLPLLVYSQSRGNAASEDLSVQKAEFSAHRLASLCDSVGYLGGATAVVDEIEIPPNVRSIAILGHDIIFTLDSSSGQKQIVKSCAFAIKDMGVGKISKAGTYFIEVSALSNLQDQQAEQVQMAVK